MVFSAALPLATMEMLGFIPMHLRPSPVPVSRLSRSVCGPPPTSRFNSFGEILPGLILQLMLITQVPAAGRPCPLQFLALWNGRAKPSTLYVLILSLPKARLLILIGSVPPAPPPWACSFIIRCAATSCSPVAPSPLPAPFCPTSGPSLTMYIKATPSLARL